MKRNIFLSCLICTVIPLSANAQTAEDLSFFYIEREQVSARVETVRASGYEVNSDHPGIEDGIVSALEVASGDFVDASDCLDIDPNSDSVDLRAIAKWRYDNLSQFEVCLQRIFSYLDGPQEIEIWLREIGFRVVRNAGIWRHTFWNSTNQTEGPTISAAWNDRPRRGAFYPLSRSFNWSSLVYYNLSLTIDFDSSGNVFDLRASLYLL